MSKIRIRPDGVTIEPTDGQSILEGALEAGLPHAHACGGNARCSTCRVLITEGLDRCGPPTPAEQRVADRLDFPAEIRLACQTVPEGDVTARRLVLDALDIELTSKLIANAPAERVGVEKEVGILFCDIRAFTSFSELLLPYDVIFILNRHFRLMDDVVSRHGGSIDNIMGDGFLALFEGEDPAEVAFAAVAAGVEMLEVVSRQLQPYLVDLFGRSFDIGVGVHYGLAVAGTLGGRGSRRATVIGDAVNFASRIEHANKEAGTSLLVSAPVAELVGARVERGRTCTMAIRGKTGEHTLHEVLRLSEG